MRRPRRGRRWDCRHSSCDAAHGIRLALLIDFQSMRNRRRAALPNQLIEIYPVIPEPLARLTELASNLFFSWHRPTRALFEDLEPELWQQVGGNLRLMLRCINQENLDRAAADRIYQERYRQVVESFDA